MKKFTTTILFFVYVLAICGIDLQVHWCGGKIASVQFVITDEHSCSCNKKPMKAGCCKDKVVYLKVHSDHSKLKSVNAPVTFSKTLAQPVFSLITESLLQEAGKSNLLLRPPPGSNPTPLFKLHQRFLI